MWRFLSTLIRTGSIGRATLLLILLGLFLIAGTAFLFLNLNERQRAITESVREDAMWAVFQTDREASRLIEALYRAQADPSSENLQSVSLRFDLVYSRGKLLNDGHFAEKFTTAGDLNTYATSAQHAILAMAKVIDPLLGDDTRLRAALPQLMDLAQALREETTQLVIATNRTQDVLRVSERDLASAGYRRLATGVLFMTLVFVSIVALQFAQLALISKTKRKLRHLSLRNARSAKAAQAASDAKSRFLATMSHEIRTPLNGIIGAADLLQDTALSDEQKKRVSTIRNSGNLLLDVITDILDYSKLEADAVTYSYAPVYLPDVAALLDAAMRPRAEEAGLSFEIDFPACEVIADGARVRQVLVNLIGNAIKFTRDGGIGITGEVKDGATLRLAVSDTGMGIPLEHQDRLFKDFSQLDATASRPFSGTGLGLAISKRIVSDMGGAIGLTSNPGKGSQFWIELPVSEVNWTYRSPTAQQATPLALPDVFEGQVLVVEDSEVNREVATAMLKRLGVTTATARNGKEALVLLGGCRFDLVLMDVQMPVMDGITATKKIREMGLSLPVVGLTANAFEEDRTKGLKAGMDDYLTKPITANRLKAVLARYTGDSRTQPPTPEGADDLLDNRHVASIVEHTGRDVFLKMLGKLQADVDAAAIALKEEGNEWRPEDRDHAFHTIKGSALTLGLRSLGQLAQEMRVSNPETQKSVSGFLSVATASIEAARTAC